MIGKSLSSYEFPIPTTTVYEITSNDLGMKKVSTKRIPKLLTLIQRANRGDCCQELLQESEVNRTTILIAS